MTHDITIRITEEHLALAREHFPVTCPQSDPREWSADDLVKALASMYYRDFEIVSGVTLTDEEAERVKSLIGLIMEAHLGYDPHDVEQTTGSLSWTATDEYMRAYLEAMKLLAPEARDVS